MYWYVCAWYHDRSGGLLVSGYRCPLGRERGMCTRRGSRPWLSLVVGGGYYYWRYASPTTCGEISIMSILLFGTVCSVTVFSFLYEVDTICVMSV